MFQFILLNVNNKVFAFLFFCFIYSAEECWWILSMFTRFVCQWRRSTIATWSRICCCNNLANKSDSSVLFSIYQTDLTPRWELDPNKRQADHLTRHSFKSFINLMSSYCMLQTDTPNSSLSFYHRLPLQITTGVQ